VIVSLKLLVMDMSRNGIGTVVADAKRIEADKMLQQDTDEPGLLEKRQRTAALQKLAQCLTHRILAKRLGARQSSAAFDNRA
jgi:hypothetical protein